METYENSKEALKKIFSDRMLGDKVHSIAQPIAKIIDKTFGTKIQECVACKERQEKLNNLLK